MILAFFWALLAELSLGEPNTWVLWTDLDGADFFWTSSNCSTTVVPDSGIVGNTPAVAPSNGGISDMIFFPDTHEVLWLEAGYLMRSWMDKTERRLLCQLPGDANATELENGNGTGAALGLHGEEGALAWTFWTSNELTAVMFFASKMTKKLWVATLTSIPPRDASHVGTWIEVIGASVTTSGAGAKPVLLAREGIVYWTDADAGGSFRSLDVPSALAGATATTLAQLGEGAWGEVHVAELTNDGRFLWIRQPAAETQLRLELILSLDALQEGPTSNYATGNVRTLYSFLDGDQPSGLAVQPAPGPGLPYRGNITQLYQQVYWSVSGPDTQARIDHLNMDTGQVSTLTYALGLERRGAAPVRPSALSVYPMPGVCVNVGCLYLRIWEECRICTVDQCDTCFLDTQDWVVKQWYASHGLFSNCIWLWPPQQGAWFVRNEVQQAKDEGLLPDDFVAQELPPDGATPVGEAVATVPPTRTATTATITSTVSSTSFTQTSTTSTSLTLSSTNPCVAIEVPDEGVLSDQSCSSMLDAWCQDSENRNINRSTLAPQSLRRDCATYPWSFKELCEARKLNSEATQSDSCGVPLWSYVLFAAGLALMLAVLVPLCCYAIMRRAQPSRGHRGTGTISGLRHAAREADVGKTGPFEDSQSHWCCRHWTRYLRKRSERSSKSTESKVNDDERRKSWETIGLCDVDAVRSSRSAASNELETEPTEPETTMSIGSPRRADESVSSSTGDLQQILKGTWQPGISLSSAALAAGRLTNAMQKFMSSTRQGDKWRLLHDVEDILRTLGSALPGNLRSTAWAWHARQSGRLHRSEALHAAEEEDLSSRLQSGVRLLEVAALTGAESLHSGRSASPLSPAVAARLQKASKLQISLDQLKTRMEELGSSKNLIRAGHLLDGYESLMRLSEAPAREEAGAEDSDSEMDQLAKEMKQLQQALEEELEGSGLPPGAWQKITVDPDRFTKQNRPRQDPQASKGSAWLKSLREATARAARFGHALKGSQGKERLSEMEKTLMEELKTCEAAAKAGDSEQSTSWKQLQKVWTQLQDQLDQVRKLQKLPGDGAEGGRLSSWAMSRSKLMPKRSHTQPLQMKDLSPELSVSAAELQVLQEEVEMFRKKLRGGAAEDGNRLLMAGRRHLQQQDVEKLLRTAKAGASHSAALVDDDALAAGQDVSTQWQQLRSELEGTFSLWHFCGVETDPYLDEIAGSKKLPVDCEGFNSRTVTGPHGHRFPNSVRVMRSGAALQMPTDSEFSTDSKWQELGGSEQAVWYLQLLDETRPSVALLQSHGCGDAERARATETFSKHLGEAYGTGTENANLSRRLHLIMTFGAGETQAELAADLQAELALEPQRPGTSGRLSLGIGSRLSPKRGQQASTSSTSKSSGSLPLDLLEASSAFLRHSEELARIRSQQSEDDGSNPMLTLGQSIYTQQAIESMELEVAKAVQDAEARGIESQISRKFFTLLCPQPFFKLSKVTVRSSAALTAPGPGQRANRAVFSPRRWRSKSSFYSPRWAIWMRGRSYLRKRQQLLEKEAAAKPVEGDRKTKLQERRPGFRAEPLTLQPGLKFYSPPVEQIPDVPDPESRRHRAEKTSKENWPSESACSTSTSASPGAQNPQSS
ncbi:unnamed protein product [Cladocopium goreaui]|uniref:Bulb-type lectin domain-containing protein n=1 Tax=Cladocopium goreaui TaxID=2562237 RepID=A0A9P1G8L1_9DINO|nr:unnamed protein product [Cladocopium goreaui]